MEQKYPKIFFESKRQLVYLGIFLLVAFIVATYIVTGQFITAVPELFPETLILAIILLCVLLAYPVSSFIVFEDHFVFRRRGKELSARWDEVEKVALSVMKTMSDNTFFIVTTKGNTEVIHCALLYQRLGPKTVSVSKNEIFELLRKHSKKEIMPGDLSYVKHKKVIFLLIPIILLIFGYIFWGIK